MSDALPPAGAPQRGPDAVRRLLEERLRDVRELDTAGFRQWLRQRLERWSRDPEFRQRVRIRELRRAHPTLGAAEAEHRAALAAERASPHHARLQELERGIEGADKAVRGLGAALEDAEPERAEALRAKLRRFQARLGALREEHQALARSTAERARLDHARRELDRLRAQSGLQRAEEQLTRLQRERGRGSGRRGADFEELAEQAVRTHLLPELHDGELRVLRGVTLGAARMEIDQLVVRPGASADRPAEVLALVEAKRNPNDLAHGFRMRQENLGWLTRTPGRYDPAVYRTGHFVTGHFDRPVEHHQDGERTLLAPGSFAGFHPEPGSGLFLQGLHLVTRPRTLWGLSSASLARLAHRVATDEAWDLDSDDYLASLLAWCRSLADPLESPDVLRLYRDTGRAEQCWLLDGG